ncbi:hypothetical protein EWM64_g2019 [Hericium alpestre]|uniref:Uncharacterized protein n=1 Tax=Hericium alpestre TaxID=135208 RepID=A0A4Z0A6M8_9AGAM|nr:hypothetical protein EWM64_g2019 [Hericium alpestre]
MVCIVLCIDGEADSDANLSPDDIRVPVSLAYHLADIYLEELDKAIGSQQDTENEDENQPAPLGTLLDPFFALAARTQSKHTYERLQSELLEPVVQSLAPSPARSAESPSIKRRRLTGAEFVHFPDNACMTDPKEEGKVDRSTLRKALLRKLFEIASDQSSRDSNRRKLYAFWRANVEDDDDEATSVDAS